MEILRDPRPPSAQAQPLADNPPAPGPVPVHKAKIIKTYPHDPEAFTQGLLLLDGFLYESTGLTGRSGIRKVDLETGRVLQERDMPPRYFGEGLAAWDDSLIQLTWHSGKAFVYDRKSFEPKGEFSYEGEGWGLTGDGKNLIMSNGGSRLTFLDPHTFAPERVIEVRRAGRPLENLNELEYVKGEIFANVWMTDFIARISPKTGEVTGWIDLSDLRKNLPAGTGTKAEALNGIAWDERTGRLFVTGKYWPKLFEVEIAGQEQQDEKK